MDRDFEVRALDAALDQVNPARRAALHALFAAAAGFVAVPVMTVDAVAAGRGHGKAGKKIAKKGAKKGG